MEKWQHYILFLLLLFLGKEGRMLPVLLVKGQELWLAHCRRPPCVVGVASQANYKMASARLMLFPGAFPAVSRRMAGFCGLCSSKQECTESISSETEKHILCSKTAQDVVKSGKLLVRDEFVSKEEEEELVKEVELSFRRMKYEYDHWDGVRIQ